MHIIFDRLLTERQTRDPRPRMHSFCCLQACDEHLIQRESEAVRFDSSPKAFQSHSVFAENAFRCRAAALAGVAAPRRYDEHHVLQPYLRALAAQHAVEQRFPC